jgi:hypothetical protein
MEQFNFRHALLSAIFTFGLGMSVIAITTGAAENDRSAIIAGIVGIVGFGWGAFRYSKKIITDHD